MSAPGLTIPTSFTANGNYVNQVNKMSNATDRMLNSVSRLNAIGPQLSSATKNILSYAKSALLVGGAFATARFSADAIMQYEDALANLSAITGTAGDELSVFKTKIEEVAKETRMGGAEVANAFTAVGNNTPELLKNAEGLAEVSKQAIIMAQAAKMELGPAADYLTSIMNQFNTPAKEAGKTIGMLALGANLGSIDINAVSDAMQKFGGVASQVAGVSMQESITAIEAISGKMKDAEKIGTQFKNIFLTMSNLGGQDPKALKDMKAVGLNIALIQNKTTPLIDRLKELRKLGGRKGALEHVFGKENVQSLIPLLSETEKFADIMKHMNNEMEVGSAATDMAAKNTNTLSFALTNIKNKWANLLTGSSKVTGVLDKFRESLFWVADHMEDILSVGGKLITGFLIWKGAILAVRGALIIQSIAMGIQNALMLESTALLGANTIAVRASIIAEKAMAVAVAISTGNWAALNSMMLANPIGLVVVGLAALVAGISYAIIKTQELTQAYKDNISVQMVAENKKQTDSVKALALEYYNVGMSIQEATKKAIEFQLTQISLKRISSEAQISVLKKRMEMEKAQYAGLNFLMQGVAPGSGNTVGNQLAGRSDIAEQLLSKQLEARNLAVDAQALAAFAKGEQDAGVIGGMNISKYLQPFHGNGVPTTSAPDSKNTFAGQYGISQQLKNLKAPIGDGQRTQADFEKQRMEIVIKNDGATTVDVKSGKTGAKSVMPNTKSSFSTN